MKWRFWIKYSIVYKHCNNLTTILSNYPWKSYPIKFESHTHPIMTQDARSIPIIVSHEQSFLDPPEQEDICQGIARIMRSKAVDIPRREASASERDLWCVQTRDAEAIDDPLNGNDRKDTGIMESLKRRDQSQMGRFRSDKSVSLSGRWRTYSDLVILAARSAGFADASTCTAALVFALLLMLNPPTWIGKGWLDGSSSRSSSSGFAEPSVFVVGRKKNEEKERETNTEREEEKKRERERERERKWKESLG